MSSAIARSKLLEIQHLLAYFKACAFERYLSRTYDDISGERRIRISRSDWNSLRLKNFSFISEDDGRFVIIWRVIDLNDGTSCDATWESLEEWFTSKSMVSSMSLEDAVVTITEIANRLNDKRKNQVLRHLGLIQREIGR